jgi:uncharacterized SAM-dependent methyltransferase
MTGRLSTHPARSELRNYLISAYRDDLASDILSGMTAEQKYIPSRYFYLRPGSQLFEEICRLPEYYPTRLRYPSFAERARRSWNPLEGDSLNWVRSEQK